MPRKAKSGGRRRKPGPKKTARRAARYHGGSAFTDFFTKTIPRAAKWTYRKVIVPTHNYLRDHHVYSTAVGMVPHPAGKVAAAGLRAAGYGRHRMAGGRSSALAGRLYLV